MNPGTDHPTDSPAPFPDAGSASTQRRGRKWSIGIYGGASPFSVSAPDGGPNPVLQAESVENIEAAYVADPFLAWKNETLWIFFEIKNRSTRQGEVGLAGFEKGRWICRGTVLREPFHLSYPYVFEWDGDHFMIPESLQPGAVRLYRADPFPDRWVYVADLIRGRLADPSIVRHQDRWWIFACSEPAGHDVLRLYHSERLEGPWREHPQSPLFENDARRARPAGRIIVWNDRLIRFAQDCVPTYGTAVRAFEITEISPRSYREQECTKDPVLSASGSGWNRDGMHHMDAHQIAEGKWIASVDGWRYWPPQAGE
jgi:hypothetical protein